MYKDIIKKIEVVINKYRFIGVNKDIFNNSFSNYTNEELEKNIDEVINECLSNYIDNYIESNGFEILLNKCESLKKLDEVLNISNYNINFDEYSIILDNDKYNEQIKKIVDKNLSEIKEGDYSFCDNQFIKGLIDCYVTKNQLINDFEDEEEIEVEEIDLKVANLDDSVKSYLIDISKYKVLSREEEYKLAKEALAGNEVSKDLMIKHNLKLVVSIAKRYIGNGLTLLDLIQEGNIGLMKSISKFDPDKGYKFSTYSSWWIKQTITRAIADKGKIVRIPIHAGEQLNKLLSCKKNLTNSLGREATIEEVAKELDMSVEDARRLYSYNSDVISINKTVGDPTDSDELGNLIADNNLGPEEVILNNSMQTEVQELLNQCNLLKREKDIICKRFGMGYDKTYTLEEIAISYGVTRERIRQVESKALNKIRRNKNTASFAAYIGETAKTKQYVKTYKK